MLVIWALTIDQYMIISKYINNHQIIGYYQIVGMETDYNNSQAPSTQSSILTIQRVLDHNHISHQKSERRLCKKCKIKENEFRNFNKVIIIFFEQTNQSYCNECLAQLLAQQQKQVRKLEEKFIYQKEFQTSITQSDIKIFSFPQQDQHTIELEREVQALEAEEKEIDYLLEKTKKQCEELQEKVYNLEQRQEKFWSDMNKFEKRALKLQQKSFIARNQGQIQKRSLQNLSRTSTIHIFFKIQIEDNYAQVYGLTIGKKPDQLEVNWEETNAGLGHLLLAYNYLVLKYGLPYTRIEDIRIKGHLSEILIRNSEIYYPVGYGINTGSVFGAEKIFGLVMEVLLAQMSDLVQHIQEIQNIQYSEQLKLPYVIEKKEGKILDLYVNPTKLEEKTKWTQWTKAMRYFLIDFKHILTIASLSDPYL